MGTLFMSMVQLAIVAIVCVVAYRSGFKAAKAALLVREFAFPVGRLLGNLSNAPYTRRSRETRIRKAVESHALLSADHLLTRGNRPHLSP